MGRQIIKQPNGKYCVYSTVVDSVTYYNCTPKEIIEVWAEEEKKRLTKKVNEIITELENGEKPYNQFTKTYDEMLYWIAELKGEEERDKVKKAIESE